MSMKILLFLILIRSVMLKKTCVDIDEENENITSTNTISTIPTKNLVTTTLKTKNKSTITTIKNALKNLTSTVKKAADNLSRSTTESKIETNCASRLKSII